VDPVAGVCMFGMQMRDLRSDQIKSSRRDSSTPSEKRECYGTFVTVLSHPPSFPVQSEAIPSHSMAQGLK
jgi:hypothetical protein